MAVATLNLRDYWSGNAMINALLLMLAFAPHDPGNQAGRIFYNHTVDTLVAFSTQNSICCQAQETGKDTLHVHQQSQSRRARPVSGASRSCVSLLQAAGTSTLVRRLTAPLPGASRRLSAPASEVNFPLRA